MSGEVVENSKLPVASCVSAGSGRRLVKDLEGRLFWQEPETDRK
jgi:hypothetical protein